MKILVSGGAGFIGSNIADRYIQEGHSVAVIDNLSSGKKENINPKARFYEADVCDEKRISEIFKLEKPEVVNHHAAQIDVRKSVAAPVFDANVNIVGIINILEASKKNGVKKVIFASSGGTIYGECGDAPPDESAKPNPLSPYGISKLCSEYYLNYYAKTYGIKFTSLRYTNVYGPRQDPHGEAGVVAIFSERLLNGDDVFIYGDGEQMRDYVYVGDVVRANLLSLEAGDDEIINIGTSLPISVNRLFELLSLQWKDSVSKAINKPPRTGELFKSFLNINRAKRVINWSPQVKIEDGLKKTLLYFKSRKARDGI